jgi:uncharacterized protein YidB (DUF937 family)
MSIFNSPNPSDDYAKYMMQQQQSGSNDNAPVAPLSQTITPITTPATNYDDIVTKAYGTIGRTGIGDAVSNIDQAGKDYWVGLLQSGAVNPNDFSSVFGNAVEKFKQDYH